MKFSRSLLVTVLASVMAALNCVDASGTLLRGSEGENETTGDSMHRRLWWSTAARVQNNVNADLLIVTFNFYDHVRWAYYGMYFASPGTNPEVQASWSPGNDLQVAIGYGRVGDQLLYRNWWCKGGSTLSVNHFDGDNIVTDGCEHQGTGSINMDSDTWSAVQAAIPIATAFNGGGRSLQAAGCNSTEASHD